VLFQGQPVAGTYADGLGALHALDAGGQFGRQQAVVRRAPTARLRIADILTMIEDDPSPRSSRVTRQADTVAWVKPGLGSRAYQEKNPSNAIE
jgi:hypothetical protein